MNPTPIARVAVDCVTVGVARRPALRIELADDAGVSGWGEAAPLAGFSPEAAPAVEAALGEISSLLVGARLREDAPPLCEVGRALAPFEARLEQLPSARFALETALLDLVARRTGRSVAECLARGSRREPVALNALAWASAGPERLAREGARLAGEGFAALKVKLEAASDEGFEAELTALSGLRRALPAGFELRLDANGAWPAEAAPARLALLRPLAPRFVEEPVHGEALLALGEGEVPWAADESLALPGMAERLLAQRTPAAVVLKPQRLGLLGALALAHRAQRHGFPSW